jgi:Protein of unknown function (DUF2752)
MRIPSGTRMPWVSTVVPPQLPVRLRWEQADRHPILAPLAAAGLLVAGELAVVGLPPIDLHGPLHRLGIMDPLCGMTRGTVALLRGQLGQAVAYNPASPLLVAGAVLALGRWLVGRLTGRWLDATLRQTPLTLGIAAALGLALWVNQQVHAALLR